MGALKTKIESYGVETGIEFDQAYTLTPTGYGSNAENVIWSLTNTAPTYYSTEGPSGSGAGSWLFPNATRLRTNSSAWVGNPNNFADYDYAVGAWVKFNALPGGTADQAMDIMSVTPSGVSLGFRVGVSGSSHATNPSKLVLSAASTTATFTSITVDTNWHYIVFRRLNQSGNNNIELYYDGSLVYTGTNTATATFSYLNLGTTLSTTPNWSFYIQNYHHASCSVLTPTAISEIWNVGSTSGSTNITITETPATASSLFSAPTLDLGTGSLNILNAPLDATALMTNITLDVSQNINIQETVSTASTLFIDPTTSVSSDINIISDVFNIDPIGLEPTIITTTSDSVNIITSIPVTSEFIMPQVTTDINNHIVLLETMDALGLLTDTTVSMTVDSNNNVLPMTLDIESFDAVISTIRNINATIQPGTATSLMLDSGLNIDKSNNYNDLPRFVSAEMLDPSWGAITKPPLYYTPGTLKSKIATYPIEYGIEFDSLGGNAANIPVYGSAVTGNTTPTFSINGTGTASYVSTDGPTASGTGCVEFTLPIRLRPTTSYTGGVNGNVIKWTDLEYTVGIWFKVVTLPSGTTTEALPILRFATSTFTSTSLDFSINLTGSTHATNPSKLNVSLGSNTYDYFGPTINNEWHYLAVRRTGSTGVNNFEVYLDGQLYVVKTNSDTSTSYSVMHLLGNETANNGVIKLQNFHLAKSSDLIAYDINDIWLAGLNFPPEPSIPAVHNAQPMFATALMKDPTIIAIIGDNVEVTTSIPVDITFPSPSWSTGDRVTINADVYENILVQIGDNVLVETEKDHSIPALEFIANAIFPEPVVARQPFKANASMLDPIVQTNPNYFSIVMKHQPVLYVEDGQASPVNYGSWQLGPWTSEYMDVNTPATEELQTIGNQKAWKGNANGVTLHEPTLYAKPIQGQTVVENLYATRRLSIELWYKSNHFQPGDTRFTNESGILYHDGITTIGEAFDYAFNERFYRRGFCEGIFDERKTVMIGSLQYVGDANGTFGHPWKDWLKYGDASPNFNEWNHVVVTYEPANNADQVIQKFYLNGSIVANNIMTYGPLNDGKIADTYPLKLNTNINDNEANYEGIQIGAVQTLYGGQAIKLKDGTILDEVAIYPKTLTPSDIIEHWTFIQNRTPYVNFTGVFNDIEAQMGNHQVRIVMNSLYESFPLPGLAFRIPQPTIIAGKSKNLFPDAAETNAEMIEPSISYGNTIYVKEMASYSESGDAKSSNNTYYQYVKLNINPYRYASFDTANVLQDHGTDTIYSVAPITIGGEVTYYNNPLNNRCVKTAGNNYLTDGVILKESEFSDIWGTDESHHSAFWMERTDEDQSTNGLRILASAYGPAFNNYYILYQYQNKLHVEVFDGTTRETFTTTNDVDLFDYNRHFIVLDFHKSGSDTLITLYVDSILKLNVTYHGNILLENSETYLNPNDETNNMDRFAAGCLIVPFANTELPVIPANTRLYIDEVYWSKAHIQQLAVTNLYNAMPFKSKFKHSAVPAIASGLMLDVTVNTGTNYLADPMLSFPALVDPIISTTRFVNILIEPLEANADMGDTQRSDSVLALFYVMLASANYGDTGTPRIIDANTMTANIALQNRKTSKEVTSYPILINGNKTFDSLSVWSNYLITTDVNKIIPMREVV